MSVSKVDTFSRYKSLNAIKAGIEFAKLCEYGYF